MSAGGSPNARHRRGNTVWMTVILLVALVAFGVFMASRAPDEPQGWFENIHDALIQGEIEHKPIFVLFTADWCPPCRKLKSGALADAGVNRYLDEKFVRVKIDLSDRQGPNNKIAFDLGVATIPAIHVYDPDGHRLTVLRGTASADELLGWLHDAKGLMPGKS